MTILDFEPKPRCPVCGAEGGNCGPADGSHDVPSHVAFGDWGDPPTERTPAMGDIVATERIWEENTIPRTTRTRRVLRYKPGDVIPEADAKRLNVKANGTQGKVPLNDADDGTVVPLASKRAATKKAAAPRKAAVRKATVTRPTETARASKTARKR